MQQRILGLHYTNENNIIREATQGYCQAFRDVGYDSEVINLASQNDVDLLKKYIDSGELAFCFGQQGVGSRLTRGEVNLWTASQIPFVALHYDNPCHNPYNHMSNSPWVINVYHFMSFYDVQRRYIGDTQSAAVLPYQMIGPEFRGVTPFHNRPIKMLYMKTGASLDDLEKYFSTLPSKIADDARSILELIWKDPNLIICDLVNDLFKRHQIDRKANIDDFWELARAADYYIRRKRAIEFVNWLKFQDGAVIIGDGWNFIDRTGVRAEFRSAIDAKLGAEIYDQAQFVCNTNPYGSDVIHERVAIGLMMGCCVVTDTNAWLNEHFSDVPALIRFDCAQDINQQLTFHTEQAMECVDSGYLAALRNFRNSDNLAKIVAHAQKIKSEHP